MINTKTLTTAGFELKVNVYDLIHKQGNNVSVYTNISDL